MIELWVMLAFLGMPATITEAQAQELCAIHSEAVLSESMAMMMWNGEVRLAAVYTCSQPTIPEVKPNV